MNVDFQSSLPANPVRRSQFANLLILAATVGISYWAWQFTYRHMTSVSSHDAVVNGVLTTINAPEQGIVSHLQTTAGSYIAEGKPLLTLTNNRVSALEQQQITSRLQQQQANLQASRDRLFRLQTLRESARQDAKNQFALETNERKQNVEQVASELQGAQARLDLAQLNYKRNLTLLKQGAVSQSALDAARMELQQSQSQVASLNRRLQALRSNQQASQLGLTLDATRSNYDPRIRLQEMELQIADQQQTIQTQQQAVAATQAELVQARKDLQRKQNVVISQPTSGTLWRSYVQNGKYVQQGEPLVQTIDCQRRWMDVLVDENAVRALQPGTPAEIELYGSNRQIFQGKVSTIRSGVGRLEAGEDVVVPIPENLRRQTQVRVEFAPGADRGAAGVFCYVGYTGKVTFQIR